MQETESQAPRFVIQCNMKRLITFLALAVAPILAAETGVMTDAERAYLVQQLEQTKKDMLASITGLSAAQWRFKSAPNVWSVAECAEHIILAEDYLGGAAQQVMKAPAVERPAKSNAEVDRKMVAGIADRSRKATAPEPITPSGKFESPEDAARAFTERRDKNIAYAKSTDDELRTHVAKGTPLGDIDAYQLLLLMSSHSGRHTAQIREVQANAGYPKAEGN
jgi:hypothetical protein